MAELRLDAEVIIVGSGLAGVGAALALTEAGVKPLMIDAGFKPKPRPPIQGNLYDYCETRDSFELLIGSEYEGLWNLDKSNKYVPARLTAPRFRFVSERTAELQPLRESGFAALQSLAQGGLANAWGAGAYRFGPQDMKGFPISPADLAPYYRKLTAEVGISGASDDLEPYFGETEGLLPPLKLSTNAEILARGYRRRRARLNARGFRAGQPRFAILSREHEGRRPLQYENLEFWEPHLPEIYTPAYTVEKLARSGRIDYRAGLLVRRWSREGGAIRVHALELGSGRELELRCRKLLIGAGAISSARLALASAGDHETRLPLLDNPALQFPLILPSRIGAALERRSFGSIHLNVVLDSPEQYSSPVQGSILDLSGPARAEFFGRFPLSARANVACIRYLLPAMMVAQVFFPADTQPPGSLRLRPDGELELRGEELRIQRPAIAELAGFFRAMGALTHPALVVKVPTGGGVHYGGSLPMRARATRRYECDPTGELHGEPGVHVLDGACFPELPAKNYSFTIMANAMRIADRLARGLARG